MRTRTGFVSNSSSSSFIVVSKFPLDSEVLQPHFLVESPALPGLQAAIIKTILDSVEEVGSVESAKDCYCFEPDDSLQAKLVFGGLYNGMHVYVGDFSDESGDTIEGFLCHELDCYIDTEDFKFYKERGY